MKLLFYLNLVFFALFNQTDYYREAKRLFDNKQYNESIQICSKQLTTLGSKDTLYKKFLHLRIDSYIELKYFDLGIKDYLKLTEIEPNELTNYVGLSYLYGETNDFSDCIIVLEKALEINPIDVYTFNNLSYYSSQMGNYASAVKYAQDGLKIVIDPVWKAALLNNEGYGLIGLKKYSEALININESIKLNPDNSFAYCFRAIANANLKNFETVCSDLYKAKNLGAENLTKDLIKQYCK